MLLEHDYNALLHQQEMCRQIRFLATTRRHADPEAGAEERGVWESEERRRHQWQQSQDQIKEQEMRFKLMI